MKKDKSKKYDERTASIVFVSPAVLFLLFFTIIPMAYSFWMSMQSYNMAMPKDTVHFVFLKNYISVLTDKEFLSSAAWTFMFAIIVDVLNIILGLGLAMLLTSALIEKYVWPAKTLLTMPMMVAPIVTATIWKFIFSPIYGVLNGLLTMWGYDRVEWLSQTLPARIAIITVEIWATTPLCMLILMAALKTIPDEIIEASKIDGGNAIQRFFYIVIPSIRNFIALIFTLRFMDAIRMFDIVYNLTNGGPGTSTETLASTIYKTAFRYYDVGKASAGAYIFFLLILFLSFSLMKLLNRKESEV